MASYSNKFTVRFFTFVLVSSQLSLASSSLSLLTDGKVTQHTFKGLFRNRRQACADGTYIYEGRTCCLCSAGFRLKSHCSAGHVDSQCEFCDAGTYSSHPNSQPNCELCRSCDQLSANLEEAEPCTGARDAKCRCKKGHFCISGTDTCRLCHSCQECGTEGVKVACTSTNDTICNDTAQGGNGAIVGCVITLVIILILASGFLVYYLRRRRLCSRRGSAAQGNGTATPEVELLLFKDLDRHQYDVAAVLGWKDMKEVASRAGISKTDIETCTLNHPGDVDEQKLQLLGTFAEKHGRNASKTLISALRNSGKKDKAEKVTELLRRDGDNDAAASSDVGNEPVV